MCTRKLRALECVFGKLAPLLGTTWYLGPERVEGDRRYCRAMVSLNSKWMCRDTRVWILKLLYMYVRNFLWSIKSSSRSVIPSNAEVAANPPVWLPAL